MSTIKVTNVKAADGTSAIAIANSTGRVTFSNNLVPSAGIDFGTSTDGSGTVDGSVLDDYEEGTWAPFTASQYSTYGARIPNGTDGARYVKIGTICYIWFRFLFNSNFDSSAITCTLPFTGDGGYIPGYGGTNYSPLFMTAYPRTGAATDVSICYNNGYDAVGHFYRANYSYQTLNWNTVTTEFTVAGAYRTT